MAKVLKLLQENESHCECHCLTDMNGFCDTFEKILHQHREEINFVFVRKEKVPDETGSITFYGNKYGEFINNLEDNLSRRMCPSCLWHVISNYNDIPIGDKIFCSN